MGRIRTIKPEFFTSPDTARASMEARVLFVAMWCWADDYGVGETNLLGLRAFAFPEEDPHLRKEIQSLCKEVADAYGVRFYRVDRRPYYQILTWDSHQKTQRRAKNRHPHYDDPNAQVDERFHDVRGSSEHEQGSSSRPQGNCIDGKGKGTGEREQGNREKDHAHPKGASERTAPSRFDEFWSLVPRKVGKDKARTAYAAAVKRAGDEQTVIDGMRRFATDPNLPEPRFIPHPTTWLSRGGWEDDPLPSRTPSPQESHTFGTRPEDWLQGLTEPDDQNVLEGEVLSWPEIGA